MRVPRVGRVAGKAHEPAENMPSRPVSPPLGLAERAIRGLRWSYLGMFGRIFAQFVSQVALARLLGPEPMGVFAYAFLTVTLCALIIEMGLGQALIQAPELTDEDVGTACGRLLLIGSVGAAGLYLCAESIANELYSAPNATPVIQAMAASVLVSGATASASAVLRRDIEFKITQLAEVGSYVLGYLIVGVAAAWLGLGVWSLVLAWHVQTVTACVAMYAYSPRSLMPSNPFRPLRMAGFGAVIMFTNILNWGIENGARVVIGRSLGAVALGQFTVASNLVRTPADHLVRNLQAVLFPLAARAQDNDAGLRRAYLTVVAGVGVVAFPLFTFVAVMAEPLILLLLGPQWVMIAQILTPLSLAMMAHAAEALCGPLLAGRGEPRVELRLQAITLVLMLAVLAVTVSWSVVAVAWGLAFVFLFRWAWMNAAVMNRLQISVRALAEAFQGSILLAGLTGGVASGVGFALHSLVPDTPAHVIFVAAAGCVAVSVMVTVVFAPSLVLGSHLLWLMDQLMSKRPLLAQVPGLRRIAASAGRASRFELAQESERS